MKTLHLLVEAEARSAQAKAAAAAVHRSDLRALHDALNQRHIAYSNLFQPLIEDAATFKVDLPEVHHYGLHEGSHRWGNSGLDRVIHEADGFTRIATADSFRGCADTFFAYIPTRYLGADGESLMQADAARVQGLIAAKKLEQAESDRAANERRERSELKRLQAKFSVGSKGGN